MKPDLKPPYIFNSISELHRALGLPKPLHPLVSLVDYGDIKTNTGEITKGMILNFYKVLTKGIFRESLNTDKVITISMKAGCHSFHQTRLFPAAPMKRIMEDILY